MMRYFFILYIYKCLESHEKPPPPPKKKKKKKKDKKKLKDIVLKTHKTHIANCPVF